VVDVELGEHDMPDVFDGEAEFFYLAGGRLPVVEDRLGGAQEPAAQPFVRALDGR
jgi:hypothetical protein